jgi:thiol:disulfide interchange protein DsbD
MTMLFAAYGWGLLSSLSACVYPLIPITTAIFIGGERKSWMDGFKAAGTYTLGMALTYGTLGMIAALSGAVFGKYLGNHTVIVVISLLLIYLGLAYAHLVPMPLPNFANRMQVGRKEGLIYPLILGIFSAFIAAPCTAPFFGSLLVQISRSASEHQSIIIPSLSAFAFAFGMATPFLLLGVFSLRLPKPGIWLHVVEYAGAVVLIAAGFHYLEDIAGDFPPPAQAFPFAVIGVAMCVTFFILAEPMRPEAKMQKRMKLNTAGMLLISGCARCGEKNRHDAAAGQTQMVPGPEGSQSDCLERGKNIIHRFLGRLVHCLRRDGKETLHKRRIHRVRAGE